MHERKSNLSHKFVEIVKLVWAAISILMPIVSLASCINTNNIQKTKYEGKTGQLYLF